MEDCTGTVAALVQTLAPGPGEDVAYARGNLTEVLCGFDSGISTVGSSLDGSFMLANTYLVFFMQVRSTHVLATPY